MGEVLHNLKVKKVLISVILALAIAAPLVDADSASALETTFIPPPSGTLGSTHQKTRLGECIACDYLLFLHIAYFTYDASLETAKAHGLVVPKKPLCLISEHTCK